MSTVSVYLMGGLGNQLFQIFAALAYGIRFKRKIVLPYSEVLTTGIARNTYWDSFLASLKTFTTFNNKNGYTNQDFNRFVQYRESGHHYSEIANVQNNEILVFGYFQSPLYFDSEKETIFSLIKLLDSKLNVLKEYPQYSPFNSINISMHFRLGDYKEKQDYHPILPYSYYHNSLAHILMNIDVTKKANIFYFCEKEDNDTVSQMIDDLNKVFNGFFFVKVDDTIEDWKQMLIMSNCHHNIIANSSFSWWGAYFNNDDDKIVCYPSLWFGPAASKNNTSTMFPMEWKSICAKN